MTNITIPTSSTTQTLTGDNGVTTVATFTANALSGPYWNRTGVGLAGDNYEPAGEAALVVEFSNVVEDFQFTLFDVDQNGTTWDDQVRVEAYDINGDLIPITFTTTGTGHVVEEDGTGGVLQIEASNNSGDNQSSIVVSIAGPVGSVRIFYEDGSDTTNNEGVINLEAMSFTNALTLDGTVLGTAGDDLIDASYVGDPDGDLVDGDDAILSGDTGDDDLILAGAGNDTVLAGDGDDRVFGGAGDDTIDGGIGDDLLIGDQLATGSGQDVITGGAGNDTIYGDSAPADALETQGPTVFSWADQSPADEDDLVGGLTGVTEDGNVEVTLSTVTEANFTSISMEKTDALYDYNSVSDTSSIEVFGGSAGTSQDAATVTLEFASNEVGYADEVENVTFGIFDLDELDDQFIDQVIIRAYDANGVQVDVTLSVGDTNTITANTAADGTATATAVLNSGGGGSTASLTGFVEVSVAGPVARIEIDYNNTDPDFGNHAIRIGDLSLSPIPQASADGNDDVLDGGADDDTIFGQAGDDTIAGGSGDDSVTGGIGDDTIVLENGFGTDTIDGSEDADDSDIDVLDASAMTDDATLDLSAISASDAENGTLTSGDNTATFDNIEAYVLGAGDDTAIGSDAADTIDLGQGADTVNAGLGDDQINLGEDSPGTPDQDADVIILQDDFGNDTITGFDAPTPDGDGTFTGIDTLDVTGLNDADSVPVNTNDVTVTDDGSGNAILNFPNGESITLIGIPATDADNPLYLNAIGIPLPPPDGVVTGTQGNDVIDASYAGDPEGDQVDAGDALIAAEAADDDIIVAQGGGDSIAAGVGADDIYGGDGADTIDAGAGDDTVYGDTPDGVWYFEYFDLDPATTQTSLADVGFAEGTADFEGVPTDVGYTDTLDPRDIDTGDDYALKFSSVLQVTTAGEYTFEVSSDDGSRIFVDGVEVVDHDGNHGFTTVTGAPVTLSAGDHVIEIIYYENTGGNRLAAEISGPDTGDSFVDLGSYSGLRVATGADTITGGTGNDTLFGGGDSDLFNIAEADDTDTITGGEDVGDTDTDTISFASVGTTDGVNVTFTGDEEGDYLVGGAGSDGDFTQIERIVGTDNADTVDLTNDTGGITVEAGAGDDSVTSGAGDDVISTGTGQDDIVINNDYGNDNIDGGSGADGTGDVLDGSGLTQNVIVDFSAAETGTVENGTDTLDFAEIEEIFTGSGDDTVLGDAGDDVVSTGAGADTLTGGGGNDTFDAGSGDDTIAGGTGADSITAGLGQDDILISDGFGNDTIDGGDGADGTGDVLDGSSLTEDVVVDLTAPETGTIANNTDTLNFSEIEEIITGLGDDTVTGGVGSDTVSTGAGEDDVTFGYGDDIDTGTDDDRLTLETQGPASNGGIFIDGGDEVRDGAGNLVGSGDVLDLGTLADLSTLSTTTDADGSLSGTVSLDDGTLLTFADIEQVICFTPGTNIATPLGARAIETLEVGDLVVTRDHGLQPIRWIQSRTVAAKGKFAPVRIQPGAVTGLETDLLVSPQHRMLFTGYRSELLFGEREVLMPAKHLVDGKKVTREHGGEVTYIHMMFDTHEVIYAEGAPSESFHPGQQGLGGITDAAREELFALFPALRSNPNGYGPAARRCLKRHETQMLQVRERTRSRVTG